MSKVKYFKKLNSNPNRKTAQISPYHTADPYHSHTGNSGPGSLWIQISVQSLKSKSGFLLYIFYESYSGQNPERFPYAEDDGMGNIKQCCGNKTYNPFTFTCCEDQVMEIGSC